MVGAILGGAALAGASSLIGGALNYHYQNQLMDKQNAFNSAQAQLNRDFQAEQNNLAYQRSIRAVQDRVADMKAAGLNPYAMYNTGSSGSSTPSPMGGSSASSGSGSTSAGLGFGSLGIDLVNTAMRMYQHSQDSAIREQFMRQKLDYMSSALSVKRELNRLLKYS